MIPTKTISTEVALQVLRANRMMHPVNSPLNQAAEAFQSVYVSIAHYADLSRMMHTPMVIPYALYPVMA